MPGPHKHFAGECSTETRSSVVIGKPCCVPEHGRYYTQRRVSVANRAGPSIEYGMVLISTKYCAVQLPDGGFVLGALAMSGGNDGPLQ